MARGISATVSTMSRRCARSSAVAGESSCIEYVMPVEAHVVGVAAGCGNAYAVDLDAQRRGFPVYLFSLLRVLTLINLVRTAWSVDDRERVA
jgi:hypothetical protein